MAHTFDGELNCFLVTYSSTIAILTRPCAIVQKNECQEIAWMLQFLKISLHKTRQAPHLAFVSCLLIHRIGNFNIFFRNPNLKIGLELGFGIASNKGSKLALP